MLYEDNHASAYTFAGVFTLSEKQVKESVKAVCTFMKNGEDIQNLLAESFALFVEKETAQSDNDSNGRLLSGGMICTQK